MYNPNTVETITGTIKDIQYVKQASGRDYGVHLMVTTQKNQYEVHLGPRWFLEENQLNFTVGEEIEVKGSKKMINRRLTLIAAKITNRDRTVVLRDEYGIPMWSGRKGYWRRGK
jgi:hypothetical protein